MAQIGNVGQGAWNAASARYRDWAGYGPDYGMNTGKSDFQGSNFNGNKSYH